MTEEQAGPQSISIKDGHLHIDGYPNANRVVRLASPSAKRLASLRLHQSTLRYCEDAMQELVRMSPISQVAASAMITGVAARYFSCFGKNNSKSVYPLEASQVFKGKQEAKECYLYWRSIRNKHLVHNESEMTSLYSGLVLGSQHEIQDVISLHVRAMIETDKEHCQLLFNLIDHTRKHVDSEIEKVLQRVFSEAHAMTPEERAALTPIQYKLPDTGAVEKTRD